MRKEPSVVFTVVLLGSFLFLFNFLFPPSTWALDPQKGSQSNLDITMSQDVYFKVEGPVSGPRAPKLTKKDYPKLDLPSPFGESRIVIWILAQQHRYFAALFLGGLFWVMVLELGSLISGKAKNIERYNFLAREILGIVALVYSITAILGVILLLGLLTLYPDFTKYLIGVFRFFFIGYGFLFLGLSITFYVYYYTWNKSRVGFSKWIHATLGVFLNVLGITIMMIANSWSSFMLSPSGVDDQGRFLGNVWAVLHNHLWNPLNVHRFFGNLIFSAVVIGAYAAFHALKSKNQDEKNHYDFVGYFAFLGVIFTLLAFPYGGYILHLEIYSFRQQMGMTLSGGIMAWLIYVLALIMGILFFGVNYYIWQKIGSEEGGSRYRHHVKYVLFILALCILVYGTPHTLVMKAQELKAIGGQQHPIIGNFGVMSSKQVAINIMMVVTIWSMLIWWRVLYKISKPSRSLRGGLLFGLFLAGSINIIWLGVYGFYIPANVRVGLLLVMFLTPLSIFIFGSILTYMSVYPAQKNSNSTMRKFPIRGHYGLLFLAVAITWIMGLGGYLRSAVRLFWHAMEVFRDASPWAFTHTMGFSANVISMNSLLFWSLLLLILWVKKIGESQIEKEKVILNENLVGHRIRP